MKERAEHCKYYQIVQHDGEIIDIDQTKGDMAGFANRDVTGVVESAHKDFQSGQRFDFEPSKKVKNGHWRRLLKDFSSTTTVHGVRQIGENTPFFIRRVVWLCLVVTGFALFTNQLITSFLYYFSYPMSVTVKINYNTTVTFPAVTICNQNAFRATVIEKLGLYTALTELYTENSSRTVEPSFRNLSLRHLFKNGGHQRDDIILSCHWSGRECNPEDITTTFTDYGTCYTFNHGRNGIPILESIQTGSAYGLTLRLNVEQYEYMKGPNSGAGVKILIHDHNEIPLVGDLGQAIPPGMQAFVGVRMLQLRNLERPHGECDDSKRLEHFDNYSIAACHVDTKAKYISEKCGCRDLYVPQHKTRPLGLCDLYSYFNCIMTSNADVNAMKGENDCPLPCKQTQFDPTITYAAISNHDLESYLSGSHSKTELLKEKFLNARETQQRVHHDIVKHDTMLIENFDNATDVIKEVLHDVVKHIHVFSTEWGESMSEMSKRIWFHYNRGLVPLLSTVDRNFVRAWDVLKERTISHMTTGFYAFIDSFSDVLRQLMEIPLNNTNSRENLKMIVQREINIRKLLARRGYDNMTRIHNVFGHADPWFVFENSPDRRYDREYISKDIFKHSERDELDCYTSLRTHLEIYMDCLDNFTDILSSVFATNEANWTHIQKTQDAFASKARSINYRLYMYEQDTVLVTSKVLQKNMDNFSNTNMSFFQKVESLNQQLVSLTTSAVTLNTSALLTLQHIAILANQYTERGINKTLLAKTVLQEEVSDAWRKVNLFFSDLRSRERNINDIWIQLKKDALTVWSSMLSERALRPFYQKIREDVNIVRYNESMYLKDVFRQMLNIPADDTNTMTFVENNLDIFLNADFPVINLNDKLKEVESQYLNIIDLFNAGKIVGNADGVFMKAFDDLLTSLKRYEHDNEMGTDFVKENFLQMNIFMRELNYEQVEQQKAYDLTALWSDIGGSLGLFVGASVITIFELLDVGHINMLVILTVLVSVALLANGQFVVPVPTITALSPGISFSIPDENGITVVGYHYSINAGLGGTAPGQYNFDVNSASGGLWLHENTGVVLMNGDVVNYWVYVNKDGGGYQLLDQSWTYDDGSTTVAPTSSPGGCSTYPCLIFEDNFDSLNYDNWQHDITAGGGGNWEFQYYTNNRSNSYTKDGNLYIKPTLTEDKIGDNKLQSANLNLWGASPSDLCTGNLWEGCERTGSATRYINPIQSALLRSVDKFHFTYGRVEVRAKMSQGDWIWPAIMLLPNYEEYGSWPASGEIDLVEARGNRFLVDSGGNSKGIDNVGSTMHWGPFCCEDRYDLTYGEKTLTSGTFGDSFHTYTMEWDENSIQFWIDGESIMTADPGPNGFFNFGGWDQRFGSETNPWQNSPNKMAPFDKPFYLVMRVAVGGTNGFFSDDFTNSPYRKPWSDTSSTAAKDFWFKRNNWYPTWEGEDAAMQVDYVRVWKMKA
ncbi:unnamed protein product [Owenia fusiformis]|uniref:Uncharacterized protein n=1 Tax=Owenia fusiformis TaxID=6347 RepID=A0A8S4Q7Z0_OWEFU|nr:unnamed protein product [Owenia fusiformis]